MKREHFWTLCLAGLLLVILVGGFWVGDAALAVEFASQKQAPSLTHFFGTDAYGRDVFLRTWSALSRSLLLGVVASVVSGGLALVIGMVAGIAPAWVDNLVCFVMDAVMSIPHLVLLVLISFSLGQGLLGVSVGIVVTHWTGLARVIRGEVLQCKAQPYVQIAQKLGQSPFAIARKHLLPHVLPQFVVGTVVLFPHAILHESALTFLGFGLPPESPTIAMMLAESMGFVMQNLWWLYLPGVCLAGVVLAFDQLGKQLQGLFDTRKQGG